MLISKQFIKPNGNMYIKIIELIFADLFGFVFSSQSQPVACAVLCMSVHPYL